MRKRLAIALALLVLLPSAGLILLSATVVRHERRQVDDQFRQAMLGRLGDLSLAIREVARAHENGILRVLRDLPPDANPDFYRAAVRRDRLMRQIFVRRPDGVLAYPAPDGTLTQQERDFLDRTRSLRDGNEVFYHPGDDPHAPSAEHGWHTWFWGDGVRLILWAHRPDGVIVGAEADPATLLADIIARLPATEPAATRDTGSYRIALVDAQQRIIYQWGTWTPPATAKPTARQVLDAPLAALSLVAFSPGPDALTRRGAALSTAIGALAVVLVLVALAVYFYRESSRDAREAAQRVSFVNQVSHELKTPLTNIRMYADLLAREIADDTGKAARYLRILQGESARLSRLILNVLSFARHSRGAERVRRTPGDFMASLRDIVDSHRPALDTAGLAVELAGDIGDAPCVFDEDALRQILGNLINNVEKYGRHANLIRIHVRRIGRLLKVLFADNGPGIPVGRREAVFEPFVRLSDRLNDGTTGTGIGLTIARQLARLHGGDLILTDAAGGAVFLLTLDIGEEGEHPS